MQRRTIVVLAGALLLISLASIWWRFGHSTLKLDHAQFRGIGQVVAEETSRSVNDRGSVVAVIDASCDVSGSTQFDNWQGFCRELKKHEGIRLNATERVQNDPADGSGSMGCPSVMFKELLERHAEANAIVFFVSLPNWSWLYQNGLLPQHKPAQIIVVDTSPTMLGLYHDYFANGLLSKLIGPRVGPAPTSPAASQTPRAWFNQYFQVYTPQNYESLPE